MYPSELTMTPEPTPCTCRGVCCCCGIRSPKKSRNLGSSIKGNCCAGRDRSVDRMVTTAGETRLTKSAYEVCKPTGADVVAAGWEGCSGARLIPRLCPLHAVKEKATRTRLARMFTREFAPFKRPIVISSLFLESQFSVKTSGWAPVNTFGYTRPLPTHRRRKLVTVSKRFFNRG